MVIGLAVILAALIGASAGGVAAIWFTNRDWRRRLAEFEECQTFLNEGAPTPCTRCRRARISRAPLRRPAPPTRSPRRSHEEALSR
jgi:hypothetical protein